MGSWTVSDLPRTMFAHGVEQILAALEHAPAEEVERFKETLDELARAAAWRMDWMRFSNPVKRAAQGLTRNTDWTWNEWLASRKRVVAAISNLLRRKR